MISVDRKPFMHALEALKAIAPSKATMPVLSSVQLTAEGGELRLSVTDLYTAGSVSVPYAGEESFSILADCRQVLDRTKRFTDGHCQIGAAGEGKNPSLSILSLVEGSRRYELRGLPGDEFPPIPSPLPAWHVLTLAASELAGAIDRVIYAASSDMTRAHLNAVRLEVSADRLRLVTTDGHRLALHELGGSADRLRLVTTDGHRLALHELGVTTGARAPADGPAPMMGFLVSLDSMTHIRGMLKPPTKGAPSALVRIASDGRSIFVTSRGVTITARLADAKFPPYDQVIPAADTPKARHVTTDGAALLSALRAVVCAASEGTGMLKLTIEPDKLTLLCESSENGKATETVAVPYASGMFGASEGLGPFTIGVNADYLIEAIEAGDKGPVTLTSFSELDPMLVRCAPGTLAVVMPIRI